MNQWIFMGRILLVGAAVVGVVALGIIFTASDLTTAGRITMILGLAVPLVAQVFFGMMLLRRGSSIDPPED